MCGSIYNLTFSHDADGKYVLIADGTNDKIWIQDRKNGALAGSIGDNGRMAGYFHWIDAIAIDSKGNLYTGEVVPASGFKNSSSRILMEITAAPARLTVGWAKLKRVSLAVRVACNPEVRHEHNEPP